MELSQLLLRDVDLLQRGGDVVERQKSALLTIGDQRPKLIQLINWSFVRKQNLVLD
jgi:hypothetical protein